MREFLPFYLATVFVPLLFAVSQLLDASEIHLLDAVLLPLVSCAPTVSYSLFRPTVRERISIDSVDWCKCIWICAVRTTPLARLDWQTVLLSFRVHIYCAESAKSSNLKKLFSLFLFCFVFFWQKDIVDNKRAWSEETQQKPLCLLHVCQDLYGSGCNFDKGWRDAVWASIFPTWFSKPFMSVGDPSSSRKAQRTCIAISWLS